MSVCLRPQLPPLSPAECTAVRHTCWGVLPHAWAAPRSVLEGTARSRAAVRSGAVSGQLGSEDGGVCSESSGHGHKKPSSHLPNLLLGLNINA